MTLPTEPTKEVETKPEEPKVEESKPEAKTEIPEKYEFKPPEGYELKTELVESISPVLKELGISQEGAQKLFDWYAGQVTAAADAPYKKFEEIQTGWRNEVLKDPTLGDGNDLKPEVKATIGRAIDSMGPQLAAEFREKMQEIGAANHPVLIRGLLALGELVTEGQPVTGKGPAATGQGKPNSTPSAAQALFPNLPSSAS